MAEANPFIQRDVITDPKYFYNRKKELAEIFHLLKGRPRSCSIVGGHKIGKSSIMHQLLNKEKQEEYLGNGNYIFVYIDFQGLIKAKAEDFYEKPILQLLKNDILKKEIRLEGYTFRDFERCMERATKHDLKVILIFDEFDAVKNNDNFNIEFFANLRSLAAVNNIAYVIASREDLDMLVPHEEGFSPFFNIFHIIDIDLFSDEAAKQLLTSSLKNSTVVFSKNDIDFIMRLAGNHPFYIQIAGYHLFESYSSKMGLDEAARHQYVKNKFIREARPHFKNSFNSLSQYEKEAVCRISSLSDEDYGEFISAYGEAELDNLLRRGLVVKNGGYNIFSTAFKEYVIAQTKRPAIEEAFLIRKEDGILIAHNTRSLRPQRDDDIMSAMLKAIQDFVRESFRDEEEYALNKLDFGKNKILIEQGKHIILAVVYTGPEALQMRDEMKELIINIEDRFRTALTEYGNGLDDNHYIDQLRGVKEIIGKLLH